MSNLINAPKQPGLSVPADTYSTPICRRCQNNACDRVPRGPLVKLLFGWLSVKRYKCTKCVHRFYKIDINNGRYPRQYEN